MSKKGTSFAKAENIEELMTNCFRRLRSNNFFQNMDFDTFIENIVDFYCVTNIIHPFREGNGRTQRVFLVQLLNFNDYIIDFSEIDTDELMIATIQASNGVRDYLINIFKKSIRENK